MNGIQALCVVGIRLALAWFYTWILKSLVKTFLPFNIPPSLGIFIFFLAYVFQINTSQKTRARRRQQVVGDAVDRQAADPGPTKPTRSIQSVKVCSLHAGETSISKPLVFDKKPPESDKKGPESDQKSPESEEKPPEFEQKPPKSVPHSIPDEANLGSTPECRQREVEKQILKKLEEMLRACGDLTEWGGTVCRETLTKIYKNQEDQLMQYHDFRTRYVDQLGSIVNVLEGHRKDIAENTSLCNIIKQYRETVENNHKCVQQHIDSVSRTFQAQDKVLTRTREVFDEYDNSNKDVFHSQQKLIEHNHRLIQEHGTSIDSVVSDHVNLVAEYQKELDALALFITANRIFTLMHVTPRWENLGDHTRRTGAGQDGARGTQHLTKGHKKLLKNTQLGMASASVVDNVQKIALTLKNTSQDMIKDTHGKPKGTDEKACPPDRGNNSTKVEHPGWKLGTSGGIDQPKTTVPSQPDGILGTTVNARHAEITEQLRHGQEDMDKLRADIGCIQDCQRTLRAELERREKLRKSRLGVEAFREKLAQQDLGRQTQCREVFSEESWRRLRGDTIEEPADQGTMTSATTTTAATGPTDGCVLNAATTITDPTNVTDPVIMPTAASASNEVVGALAASDHVADAAVEDGNEETVAEDDGEGRLLDESLGHMFARQNWPYKKKPHRTTR